ncbi:enoyl-CoA hydratase/isomerase family protein [Enemella sp. A6]|uniref:enoyl-CoA hydratase/isomerase family protein n=1 Tax=Enemella sp. A6 TaxID=3440152 RepID=UPI003EBD48BE
MEQLLVDQPEPGLFVLTLNKPERLNPLSLTVVRELHEALGELDRSRHVRGVVITGAGRGFCSGAELRPNEEMSDARPAENQNPMSHMFGMQELIASLHDRVHRMKAPVVAAVNGPAVGGGLSLSLACDLRYAAESAQFGAVFIKVGVSGADMGCSYFLPRIVGAARATELMMTGRIFSAAEAQEYGLVLDVVPDGTVVDTALAKLREIAQNAPMAVWMTKQTMWLNMGAGSLRQALDVENRTQTMLTGSGETDRAREAFVNKTSPTWLDL